VIPAAQPRASSSMNSTERLEVDRPTRTLRNWAIGLIAGGVVIRVAVSVAMMAMVGAGSAINTSFSWLCFAQKGLGGALQRDLNGSSLARRLLLKSHWFALMTDSMERSADFYGRLLGWEFQDSGPEFGHYHMITRGGVSIGGAMQNSTAAAGMPEGMEAGALGNCWTVYLSTPDIDALVRRAAQAEAQRAFDPLQVGPLGWQGMITDPSLGGTGAWQPLDFPGMGQLGGAGFPTWFELRTPLFNRARELLRDVFDWEVVVVEDTPTFRYAQQHAVEQGRAGLFDLAVEADAHPGLDVDQTAQRFIYVDVPDIRLALSTVIDLGGAVIQDAQDTPYGILADVTDPLGTAAW